MRLQLIEQVCLGAVLLGWATGAHATDGTRAADHAPAAIAEGTATSRTVTAHASAHTAVYTDTDHVMVVTPVVSGDVENPLAGYRLEAAYLVDVISAASVDIVSTASRRWQETRHAGTLDASYGPKNVTVHATGAISREPDYAAIAGGARVTWDFWDKNHTLLVGFAHDQDTIGRTGTSFDVFSHKLDVNTFDAGLALTLNRSTLLSLVSDLILERGDQSKPYRYIPMFSASVAPGVEKGASMDSVNAQRLAERPLEHLPETRERYALTARFGHRFDHATLRIDERVYSDSWNLHASTTEIRYYVDVSRRLMLWPKLRVHGQTATYFWRRAYVATLGAAGALDVPRYRTGDRELGPLGTVALGFGGSFAFGSSVRPSAWTLVAQVDAIRTQFLDDLYVTSRTAALGTLGVEGAFE
ncbi:MAG TPA: DUF3570 domain-containing protein [Polyangiaceae bacterium]